MNQEKKYALSKILIQIIESRNSVNYKCYYFIWVKSIPYYLRNHLLEVAVIDHSHTDCGLKRLGSKTPGCNPQR